MYHESMLRVVVVVVVVTVVPNDVFDETLGAHPRTDASDRVY
jgi:hypothetical protein